MWLEIGMGAVGRGRSMLRMDTSEARLQNYGERRKPSSHIPNIIHDSIRMSLLGRLLLFCSSVAF